jgi:hypothetical protein
VLLLLAAAAWHLAAGPLWPADVVTLGEAVATGNQAEVLRQVSLGTDPNVPSRIRTGLLTSSGEVTLTALEAAVLARRADMLALMLANGPPPDGAVLQRLRCFERFEPEPAIEERLRTFDSDRPLECAGVVRPFPH